MRVRRGATLGGKDLLEVDPDEPEVPLAVSGAPVVDDPTGVVVGVVVGKVIPVGSS